MSDLDREEMLEQFAMHLRKHHREASYDNGDHPDERDTAYSVGAEAIAARRRDKARITALEADLASARAENEQLREALGPFDKMAGELFARNFNQADEVLRFDPPHQVTVLLTFADFLAARAALATPAKEG